MNNPAASGRGIRESILFRRKRRGIYPKEIKYLLLFLEFQSIGN